MDDKIIVALAHNQGHACKFQRLERRFASEMDCFKRIASAIT